MLQSIDDEGVSHLVDSCSMQEVHLPECQNTCRAFHHPIWRIAGYEGEHDVLIICTTYTYDKQTLESLEDKQSNFEEGSGNILLNNIPIKCQ